MGIPPRVERRIYRTPAVAASSHHCRSVARVNAISALQERRNLVQVSGSTRPGASNIERPAIFGDQPFAAALSRNRSDARWLLVDVADASNPVSWAAGYTTWRDTDLVSWVEANAEAIRVDVRSDPEAARALQVDAASVPMVILFRHGRERLRLPGRQAPGELLRQLARIDVADDNLALARRMLKDPDRDMMARVGLAEALLRAGLYEEALGHYDWLWQHMAEVDPETAGVRVSFMAREIAKLCYALPAARLRFAELRDAAAAAASTDGRAGLQACEDFVVLNDAMGDDERTLAWFDGLDSGQRRALHEGVFKFHLLPLLYERERWAEAGDLIRDPLVQLERLAERAKMLDGVSDRDFAAYRRHLIADGDHVEAAGLRRLSRGLHAEVAALYRSLVAAGRGQEAAAVKEGALRIEDSPAMRAALR
jgi:hypothetical protein